MMAGERLSFQITFIVLTLLSLEVKGKPRANVASYVSMPGSATGMVRASAAVACVRCGFGYDT